MPEGPEPNADVAQLMYEVAGNAFAAQAGLVQDMRGRGATLVTVGPAAAGVIVATTSSSKLDVLATISLVLFAVAVSQSILALWRVRGIVPGPTLPNTLPAGTDAAALQLALAQKTNAFREQNAIRIAGFEGLFWTAAAFYLLAVLVWSVHAAANTGWLFVLH